MNTLFVQNLTVIDFSYLDTDLGLLGESWGVDIELDGSLNHQGMVLDFSEVKKQVKKMIDEEFDHRLILPSHYKNCQISTSNNRSQVTFTTTQGTVIHHKSPSVAISELPSDIVTEQTLANEICNRLRTMLPDNVDELRIHLHAESTEQPWYRYSHGLKHHSGNCQRIAHGHRSRIQIFLDGTANHTLETEWAKKLCDSYIGNTDDLIETIEFKDSKYCRFGYTANQGQFELQLPQASCYFIGTDSTVENLAQHFAETIKADHPDSEIRVIGFEGIGKGAVGLA